MSSARPDEPYKPDGVVVDAGFCRRGIVGPSVQRRCRGVSGADPAMGRRTHHPGNVGCRVLPDLSLERSVLHLVHDAVEVSHLSGAGPTGRDGRAHLMRDRPSIVAVMAHW